MVATAVAVMKEARVPIASIVVDAGTQIRAAISEDVVAVYAERMAAGDEFPAVCLFHDGNHYYLADGFHRCLAAQRNGLMDVPADVRVGTKTDALWFALGANRVNGHQLTTADKKHAIVLALQTWPERSGRQLAEQIGCNHEYVTRIKNQVLPSQHLTVTGKDGKSYPASRTSSPPTLREEQNAEIARRVKAGETAATIMREMNVGSHRVTTVRKQIGVRKDLTRDGVKDRHAKMRALAAEGHSSRQIAEAVGLSEEGCRSTLRKIGVDVPADRVVGGRKHHDSTRIVGHIVMDAENLTADLDLIDYRELDRAQLPGWIASLRKSRTALSSFITRLSEELESDGEAH